MNFIDFMAILPVFLTMILEGLEYMRVGDREKRTLLNENNHLDYWQSWEGDQIGSCHEDNASVQTR